MIGGIFETIGKTLGIGKEKYFLELDDAAEEAAKGLKKSTASATKAAKAAVESAKEATVEAAEKAQELVSDTGDQAEATAKTAVNQAKSAAGDAVDQAQEQAKEAAKAVDEKADKTVAKGKQAAVEGKQAAEGAADAGTQASNQVAAPTRTTEEDLILNAIASTTPERQTDNDGNTLDEIKTFSTDYLMTPSRARRRRPGPSLSPFKGMASEVNPRLKS